MARGEGTPRTLDVLEARRLDAEKRVAESVERAEELLQAFATQAEAAHELLESLAAALAGTDDPASREPPPPSGPAAGAGDDSVPEEGSADRGGETSDLPTERLGRLRRWLLRDVLEDLEAEVDRGRQRRRRDAELREWLRRSEEGLRRGEQALTRMLRDQERRRHESFAALVGAMLHQVEAQAAILGVHEALLRLGDARSAETVRRSVDAIDARMEKDLEELGRRQEALLSDLVGRRRHLEELLERLRS